MVECNLNFENLNIYDGKTKYFGGGQEWYNSFIKRKSGCGPTTATTIAMYEQMKNRPAKFFTKQEYQKLMDKLWEYITPGFMGVNKIEIYEKGYVKFVKESNQMLVDIQKMHIPAIKEQRPTVIEAFNFLYEAIKNDHPVAFLNLDHGKEMKLESWHWVTIVGISYSDEFNELYANIADDGLLININLGLWLETSIGGGGFIYFQ